jgi:hypothetical protein
MTDDAPDRADEVLEFGARRRVPPRVAQSVAALAVVAALGVGGTVALAPRVEAGHGSVAAPPRAAPDRSDHGRARAAVGSTVRGYYLR